MSIIPSFVKLSIRNRKDRITTDCWSSSRLITKKVSLTQRKNTIWCSLRWTIYQKSRLKKCQNFDCFSKMPCFTIWSNNASWRNINHLAKFSRIISPSKWRKRMHWKRWRSSLRRWRFQSAWRPWIRLRIESKRTSFMSCPQKREEVRKCSWEICVKWTILTTKSPNLWEC